MASRAAQKEALYDSGVAGAKDFLAHWDFEEYKRTYRTALAEPRRREQVLPGAAIGAAEIR